MSDQPTPKYLLKLEAQSNGRLQRPVILALRGDGSPWFTHKEDIAELDGMSRAAERVRGKLQAELKEEVSLEDVQGQLEALWAELLRQRQQQKEAEAAEEAQVQEGAGSAVELLLTLADAADYCHGPDGRAYA